VVRSRLFVKYSPDPTAPAYSRSNLLHRDQDIDETKQSGESRATFDFASLLYEYCSLARLSLKSASFFRRSALRPINLFPTKLLYSPHSKLVLSQFGFGRYLLVVDCANGILLDLDLKNLDRNALSPLLVRQDLTYR
jgi:hypothetical protein